MLSGRLGTFVNDAKTSVSRLSERVYPLDIAVRSYKQFSKDNGSYFAAAMSYYVLFSLFPLLIFVVVVFGLIVRDPAIQQQVVDRIVQEIPPGLTIRSQIEGVLDDLAKRSSPLLAAAGLIGTAWTASGMFAALRHSLNLAFDVPRARSFFVSRLMDVLLLPMVIILALLSIGASALVHILHGAVHEQLENSLLFSIVWNINYFLTPYIASFVVFLFVYRLIPNHRLPLRYLAVGAAVAAVGFELAKLGFGIYLTNFDRFQEIYGALGGVIAFLFFVFIVSNIIIFGAEVSSEISKDYYLGEQTMRLSAYRDM